MLELNEKTLIQTLVDKYGVHKALLHYVSSLHKHASALDAMARDNNPTAMATQVSAILEDVKSLGHIVGEVDNIKEINNIKTK